MASVRKREWTYNGENRTSWVVDYTDASGKRRMKTFRSKKEADRGRLTIETEIEMGEHTPKSQSSTVRQICDDFLKQQEIRLKDGRIGRARYDALKHVVDKHIIPRIGNVLLVDLHTSQVEEMYRSMLQAGSKPRSAKDRIYNLKLIQDFAIKKGRMKKTPVDDALKDLKGIKIDKVRTFTKDEVRLVLETAQISPPNVSRRTHWRMICFVHLAAFCGLRKGEVFGLALDALDFDRRVVKVRRSVTSYGEIKGPKTKAGIRDVPMPERVAEVLRYYIAQHYEPNPEGLIFMTATAGASARGAQVQAFTYHKWRPLLTRAGLWEKGGDNFHFHALRHFYASWLIDGGLPVTEVAKLLGHSVYDMTLQVYAHPLLDQSQQLSAIDRMTRSFDTASSPPMMLSDKSAANASKSLILAE